MRLFALAFVLASLILVGCAGPAPDVSVSTESPQSADSPADSSEAERLVADLVERGFDATITAASVAGASGSFFSPGEFLVEVDGGSAIRVFPFQDARSASEAAALVSPDGIRPAGTGDTVMGTAESPTYPAPAHFFLRDKAIVVYLATASERETGKADSIIEALRALLGAEFAASAQ